LPDGANVSPVTVVGAHLKLAAGMSLSSETNEADGSWLSPAPVVGAIFVRSNLIHWHSSGLRVAAASGVPPKSTAVLDKIITTVCGFSPSEAGLDVASMRTLSPCIVTFAFCTSLVSLSVI
jgi:hypothetical protein